MNNKYKKPAIIVIALVLSIIVFKIYLFMTPLVVVGGDKPQGEIFDSQTSAGNVFMDVSECAQRQKGLYQYLVAYVEKHQQIPESLDALVNDDPGISHFIQCPSGYPYAITLQNYGNPASVLIAEIPNQHPSTFHLWIRGIKPCVRTMGDGTVHMFKGGNISLTIDANNK